MGIGDKVGGRAKQAAGSLTGSEALRREGMQDEKRADLKEEQAREQAEADRQQERADEKAREVERLERGGRRAGSSAKRGDARPERDEARGGPEPIPGYDDMNADEVRRHLDGLSDGELEEVRDYELRHDDRKTVLDAIESKRRA